MKKIYLSVLGALAGVIALAQDNGGGKIDVNVNTNKGGFFSSPWLWIAGAAVFILLLVALTRGGNKGDS